MFILSGPTPSSSYHITESLLAAAAMKLSKSARVVQVVKVSFLLVALSGLKGLSVALEENKLT